MSSREQTVVTMSPNSDLRICEHSSRWRWPDDEDIEAAACAAKCVRGYVRGVGVAGRRIAPAGSLWLSLCFPHQMLTVGYGGPAFGRGAARGRIFVSGLARE